MEITMFGMYLFTRVDSLRNAFIACLVLVGIYFVICFIGWVATLDVQQYIEANKKWGKSARSKIAVFFGIIFGTIVVCVPSQKELAAIYIVPKIVNNEQIQEIPTNALNLINTQFKAWIEDITPQATKKAE